VVLSTNLAETSITIDDCVFVVDAGRMKEKRFDPLKSMESLETVWVTRANALQRKGRAGRVRPGFCFHLYTDFRYSNHFRSDPVPEIQRVPLEQMVLRIKVLPLFAGFDLFEVDVQVGKSSSKMIGSFSINAHFPSKKGALVGT
jgi:ATP-dependent RNA helicase DHX57